MNRSRVTGDLASHGNIFVDIANDRVGIGSTIPGQKLSLPDSAKIALGNSADLQLYHDGSTSFIKEAGTGNLELSSEIVILRNAAQNETTARFIQDGAVELYYNNAQKFVTTNTGAVVTGILTATSFSGDGSNLTGITQTTINNNANNRVITGSGTANTLEAESNVQIDSSGRLLIGTTTEGNASADDLTVATSGNTGITIRSGASNNSQIYFSRGTSGNDEFKGVIRYDHSNDQFVFVTGDTLRTVLQSDGHFRAWSDSNYDLGTNSIRWRNVYADTLYGDGTNITAVNATTLDSIDSGSFLRSDANDTYSANLTFSQDGQNGFLTTAGGTTFHNVGGSSSKKLVLRNLAELRFQDGADWNYNEWAGIKFVTSSDTMYIGGAASNNFTNNGGAANIDVNFVGLNGNGLKKDGNTVWHAGNDGSGSGLDADTLDGIQGSSFLRSDANDTLSAIITGHASDTAVLRVTSSAYSSNSIYIGGWSSSNSNNISRIRSSSNFHIDSPANGNLYLNWYASNKGIYLGNTGQGVYAAGSNVVWHAGNDGSGSGLDSDTVDGIQASSFLRSDVNDASAPQRIEFSANNTYNYDTIATSSGSQGCIEIFNDGDGNDAFMAFHGGSDFAFYFGLDADINDLSVGGWSMGASKYRVFHAGNPSSAPFLRSDTADTAVGDITFSGGAGAATIAANSDIRFTNGNWTGESCKIQHHSSYLYIQAPANGFLFRNAAGNDVFKIANDGHLNTDQGDIEFDCDAKFNGNAGAVTIAANGDIRFTTGTWTGESTKIQHHSNWLYIQGGSNGHIFRRSNGNDAWVIQSDGHFRPSTNNAYDIGTSGSRVANIYVNDLQLSNKSKKDTGGNDVDGTWGDWTIQEGESELFLINNRNDKKYKFNLTEVTK